MQPKHPRKVAIVTGGARGIGRAIAERLAADGFALAIQYAGNHAAAQQTVAQIQARRGQAIAVQGDVGEGADVAALFAAAHAAFGRIDVVVNSAGIMPLAPIAPASLADFDALIHTNLRGAFLVLGQAAQLLLEGGRIVTISSSVIAKSFPDYGPYIASKAAVEAMVPVLANELRGRNITVNAVAPGPVATELFLKDKSPEQVARLASLAPLQRLGTPEDIAAVVSFLSGPDGGWVNGQVLRANGGFA